jgi:mono/diheme cytochrome c family protein
MRSLSIVIAGAALTAAVIPAPAEDAGNARAGHMVAEMICAQCHAVERGRIRSPNGQAPTFESIAMARGMTEMALRVALKTAHREMPNLALGTGETDDVVAYIESLKNGGGTRGE